MRADEYVRFDASGLAALIASGEVTTEEVMAAARARIAMDNPRLNAVIDLYDEPERAPDLGGPFAGVPFLLKDIGAGVKGRPTRLGSRAFLDAPPQRHDDALTMRFKAAGLQIIGKTNLPELGFNVTTEPEAFGPTRNPLNTDFSAGGSSGGAAAAVASGMVPVAHATDGAGSIRIPAACCGVIGLKPSRGLIPQGPLHSDIYGGLVSEGVITRTIRDMAAALQAMAGRDAGAPYAAPPPAALRNTLRIGVLTEAAPDIAITAEARSAVDLAVHRLQELGHAVAPLTGLLAPEDWLIPRRVYLAQVCGQAAADWPLDSIPGELEEINRAAIRAGREMSARQFVATIRSGHDFCRRFAAVWQSCDLVLTPALSGAAPKLGAFPTNHSDLALHVDRMAGLAPYASIFNLTGGPALVMPVMRTSAGLSLGVQLAGDLGFDQPLLALGAQLERFGAGDLP
jgi:Asp-tRNA(Asn)/Glu-tRNA(Gln) amidotransferase A subunit family amidase